MDEQLRVADSPKLRGGQTAGAGTSYSVLRPDNGRPGHRSWREIAAVLRKDRRPDLKQLVADLSLEVHRFKKTAIPTLDEGTGT